MSDRELCHGCDGYECQLTCAYPSPIVTIRALEAEIERMRDVGADLAMGRKVVVPVEPTKHMIEEGRDCVNKYYVGDIDMESAYRAMIRAAQEGDKADE